MEALVIIGIAMSYTGNSRPASGSEHHLSHYFEITGIVFGREYFLHGIDVAYSTVCTAAMCQQLLETDALPARLPVHDREHWLRAIRRNYGRAAEGVIGMLDTRIRYVFSNNAGCSGDALYRGNTGVTGEKGPYGRSGETIRDIVRRFPYWFCPNYRQYAETNIPDTFDQHYLLTAIAPRFVSVAASAEDDWADPVSEQLCCLAAGEQGERLGLPGLVHNDRLLTPGETLPEGRVAFQLRAGAHFLSYHNWLWNMEFIERHKDDTRGAHPLLCAKKQQVLHRSVGSAAEPYSRKQPIPSQCIR